MTRRWGNLAPLSFLEDVMEEMTKEDIAWAIESAYEEAWGDYDTPCAPSTLYRDAWNASMAKALCDKLRNA